LTIEDIDFENIKNRFKQQQTKTFMFVRNGTFKLVDYSNELDIDTSIYRIKNNNTIVFNTKNGLYTMEFLLRWKNYKGCCGPAWQIALRKKTNKK